MPAALSQNRRGRGIKRLDDRFANPAYGLLVVVGLAMTFSATLIAAMLKWGLAPSSTRAITPRLVAVAQDPRSQPP